MAQTLNSTINKRSSTAASSNTETRQAKVTSAPALADGSTPFVSIRIPGQTNDMQQVMNVSGQKLSVGDTVTLNFVNGNRHRSQIIGAAGAGTSSSITASADANSTDPPQLPSDLETSPVILQTASATAPAGFVETAGANVTLTPTSPVLNSDGSVATPGEQLVAALLVRVAALPDPTTTTLPIGTIYELTDASGNSQGLYRLEAPGGSSPNDWHQISGPPSATSASAGLTITDSFGNVTTGVTSLVDETDTFTGDGTTTAWNLTNTPVGDVVCIQQPSGRRIPRASIQSVSGKTVTLAFALPANSASAPSTLEIAYKHE